MSSENSRGEGLRQEFPALANSPEAETEDLRRQGAQLEAALRLQSQQLAEVLHELRSPLLAVAGYSKLLLKERAGPVNGAQREYLEIIRENAAKMTEILKRASRRTSAGSFRSVPLNVRELWREGVEMIRPQAQRRLVSLAISASSEACVIAADRDRLALAFYQTLSDAVRSAAGGRVDVDVRRRDEEIVSSISIQGAPTEAAGSGEPSSAACETIRMCGGTVSAENISGAGLRLTLAFPAFQADSASGGSEANEQANRVGGR